MVLIPEHLSINAWVCTNGQKDIQVFGFEELQFLSPMELGGAQISDEMVMLTKILGVFILFGKVPSGSRICGLFQKVILYNCGGRFEMMLLFWFTIFAKIDGFKKFKIVTCTAQSTELGNLTFTNQMPRVIEIFKIKFI